MSIYLRLKTTTRVSGSIRIVKLAQAVGLIWIGCDFSIMKHVSESL